MDGRGAASTNNQKIRYEFSRPWRDDKLPRMDEVAIKLHIEPLAEGGFLATSPDVPGLVAEGRTVSEAVEIARDVARKIADSCIEHGDPLPPALAKPNSVRSLDVIIPVGVS